MRIWVYFATALFCLGSTGCIQKIMLNGELAATRQASPAIETIGDYELLREVVPASLAQLEGMHRLGPKNEDGLFMLAMGWAGYGYGFVEEDMEAATADGKEELAAYHKKRATDAYSRAVRYGLEHMSHKAEGFEAVSIDDAKLRKWLEKNFTDKEDAEILFWTGYAWLARAGLLREDNAVMEQIYVGIAMLERSRTLDPEYNHWTATIAIASYYGSSPLLGFMDKAKSMFEESLKKTDKKALSVQLSYATYYFCNTGDEKSYDKYIEEVLAADDPDPEQRATNSVAKRRAVRWKTKKWKYDNCGFERR